MNKQNAAIKYYNMGLIPIPVKNKKSLVEWKQYQTQKPDKQQVLSWFTNGADIALITGKLSGILVLDLDTKEAFDYVAQQGLPPTWINKTNKGYHYYFKYDETLSSTTTISALNGIIGLDVRGEGGYAVSYNWVQTYEPWTLPLAAMPDWLKNLLQTNIPTIDKYQNEQKFWVKELLKGVQQGSRHSALTRLCGYYFSHLPSDIAREHLLEWNKRNDPPIDDDELQYQLSDFETKYKNGEYISTSLFQEYETEFKPPVDCNTFLGTEPPKINWIVENLVPAQGAVILGGREKIGKSWLMKDLAIEIAKGGGLWLDSIPVKGGKVLYIDEESTDALLKLRFTKLLKAKNLVHTRLDLHFMVGNHLNFNNFNSVDNLRKTIEKLRPTIVFIDSLIRVHMAEENSATEMKKVFKIVKKLKQEYNCTFFFADHERKMFEDRGQNRLRGTTEKAAFIDSLISLHMKENHLIMEHTFSRFAPPINSLILMIEDLTIDSTKITCLHIG